MRRVSRSDAQLGFSLIEALVALAITVVMIAASTQIMVSMKRGSDQLRFKADARNTARRAMEYVAYHVRTASDLNRTGENEMAVVTWYRINNAATQASYNNVTNAALADVGTDILTVAAPTSGLSIPCEAWHPWGSTDDYRWNFDLGCPDPQNNADLFMAMTGYDAGTGLSGPIVVIDTLGTLGIYRISNYQYATNRASSCTPDPGSGLPGMAVTANPAAANVIAPMGGQLNLVDPGVVMKIGVVFRSFRVRNGWLEQKDGLFNPATDNPGNAFVQILPGVEDLQVAWLFDDSTTWNTATQVLPNGTYLNNVPTQGAGNPYDAENVVGLRITVVAQSAGELYGTGTRRYRRPAVEDRAQGATTDRRFHHASTDLVMIRNRNLQL